MPHHLITRIVVAATIATLAASGCSNPSDLGLVPGAPPIFSVEYPLSVQPSGHVEQTSAGSWQATVRFTNIGSNTAHVQHGACSVAVWLYRAGATSGPPAWDNRLPANTACIAIGYTRDIPAGEAYDLPAGLIDHAHTGLSAGRYRVVLAVRPQSVDTAPLVVLPAGEITLP